MPNIALAANNIYSSSSEEDAGARGDSEEEAIIDTLDTED
jgi:hypothetical protein